jgi:drug/metabolite transporter (DMT)-like permease
VGNYLAMLLWIGGFKYNSASVASILNQTATLFTVVLAVVFLGEKLTGRKLVAVALGFVGSVLVLVS